METKSEVLKTIEKIEGLDHRLDKKNKVNLDEYSLTLRTTSLDQITSIFGYVDLD